MNDSTVTLDEAASRCTCRTMLGIWTLVGIAFASAAAPVAFGLAVFCDLATNWATVSFACSSAIFASRLATFDRCGDTTANQPASATTRDQAGGDEGEDSGCDAHCCGTSGSTFALSVNW